MSSFWPAASPTSATCRCAPAGGSARRCARSASRSTSATSTPELLPALVADPPAAVFPLLHGAAGEDGSVRDVLELLRTPYVGSGPRAARVAWDKPIAKTVVRRRRPGHPGVGDAAAGDVPRARRRRGARRGARAARPAAGGQADPRRLGAGLHRRPPRRGPAGRDGRPASPTATPRCSSGSSPAPRSRSASSTPATGRGRCPPSRSCPTAASTTTTPATPPAPPSSSSRPGSTRRSRPRSRRSR